MEHHLKFRQYLTNIRQKYFGFSSPKGVTSKPQHIGEVAFFGEKKCVNLNLPESD